MHDLEQTHIKKTKTQEVKEQELSTRNKFVNVETMFIGMTNEEKYWAQSAIYEGYARAMEMRGREPLEEDNFFGHFFGGGNFEKSIAFGGDTNGYLFGSDVNDVFVPTHFAPTGLRQGYRLIKDLLDDDKPTALFITQDLVDTIQKMDGWKILPFKIKADFRGDVTEKTLVVSQWSALRKLAVHHLSSKVKESFSGLAWRFNKLGEQAKTLIGRHKANADDLDQEVEEYIQRDHENS